MDKYFTNQLDLTKHIFINPVTIAGLAVLVICYVYKTGNFELQSFLFTVGITILFLGITIGYANKSIEDQTKSQAFFESRFQEIENKIITFLQSQKNNTDAVEPQEKIKKEDSVSLSDEEKIIFEHLFDRHKSILAYVDTFDLKIGTLVGLSGLILSFSIFSADKAKTYGIFLIGVTIIVFCIFLGFYIYQTRDWFIGASVKFFEDCDNFSEGVGLQKLKKQLLLDIERNQNNYERRIYYFNKIILIMIVGISFLLVGYYV